MNDMTMQSILENQRKAFLGDGFPSATTLIDRIDRVKAIHIRFKRLVRAEFNIRF
jgi:hypothetical protein